MGTSGGEPRVLLNALKPMLGIVGDIRTAQEVMRVVGMMKDAEKLMSRCIYLNILKATCRQAMQNEDKRNTLDKFLMTGGWGILNKWLHEFIKSENFPVLLELIDVLKILPITVDLLKQGNTGKLIRQMTKLENADVKKNALSLIRQWKDMIKGGPSKKPSKENENGISNGENGTEGSIKRSRDQDLKGPPEKKSKAEMIDSSGFMNALNAVAPAAPLKKKRRNSDSKTTLPLDEILNRQNDKKSKVESDKPTTPDGSAEVIDPDASTTMQYVSPAVEAANQALAADTDMTVVVDEGSLARKKNKKKRSITWAADENLVQISYFEVLESERKRFHGESFSQARQHELMLEKQAMRSARRGEDRMIEKLRWSRLIPVDNSGIPNFVSGEKSKERYIQADREKSSLAFIFLTKESLPDTPKEPEFDPDEHTRAQPRMIPHDEEGTIMPKPKPSISSNPISRADNEKSNFNSSNAEASKTSTSNNNNRDVSPAVQNILSQLLRTNQQSSNDSNQKPQQPQTNQLPTLMQQNVSGPGQNALQNQANQQNRMTPFFGEDGRQPNVEMMSRGGPIGPRFRGGPRPNNNSMNRGGRGGQGGFLPRNGAPMRPQRWEGPPGSDEWNNYNQNFNDGNYGDNYMPGPNGRGGGNFGPGFNENYNQGFRPRGGMRHDNTRNRDWNNESGQNERRNVNDWQQQRGRGRGRGGGSGNRGNWRKW